MKLMIVELILIKFTISSLSVRYNISTDDYHQDSMNCLLVLMGSQHHHWLTDSSFNKNW